MSWNKEKVTKELEAKSLREGVIQAVRDKPELGCRNVLDYLEEGTPSDRQIANGLLLLLEFVRSNKAKLDCDRYLKLIQRYVTSENEHVRFRSAYCLVNITLWAQGYENIIRFKPNTEVYLDLIESNCPEVYQKHGAQIKYIRELNG